MDSSTSSLPPQFSPTNTGSSDVAQPLPAPPILHAVRKPAAKPWRKPELLVPRVYLADNPRTFRQLVQRLTGAPRRPPPLSNDDAGPASAHLASARRMPLPATSLRPLSSGLFGERVGDVDVVVPTRESAAVLGDNCGAAELLLPPSFSSYFDLELLASVESGERERS
ncbi:hypothetical protein Cni_G26492 [Canna indica]|uniref:VQ domain-containing protein n=1 Tax=Canna indica TaxID=4628 RepID=A0AAQ3QNF6_9LILI|nr:hypothetical protein Cni_G26492 [Canna indica]